MDISSPRGINIQIKDFANMWNTQQTQNNVKASNNVLIYKHKKVKSSMCLIQHQPVKIHGGAEAHSHVMYS
jgi:hypothetical protein